VNSLTGTGGSMSGDALDCKPGTAEAGIVEHLQTLDSGVGELSIIPRVNSDALQISRQRPNSRIPVSGRLIAISSFRKKQRVF
jgi:hypothetical protein